MKNFVSFFFVLALPLASTSAMAAASTDITRDEFTESGTLFNPCASEEIDYLGTTFITIRTTTSDSGHVSRKISIHFIVKGNGVTTGAKYIGANIFNGIDSYDSADRKPAVYNFKGHGMLVAQGGVPNSKYQYYRRVTVNANGVVTHLAPADGGVAYIEGCN